ncbi:hypothetical protein CFter6_3367 [Collimonas fungivorans]|uniref:Uncharacterized protein n=1 Tax=Collimonas fungivorans TaxID=158899 RepID=A0A127PEZ7_9BURK|nr:hypothetical protein CFter6_3367 [Collimonas fungivorans]
MCPNRFHFGADLSRGARPERGRESEQRIRCDLPAHLHQALADAGGAIRQSAAFGLAADDGRYLGRIMPRRLRPYETPEIRLQIDQNGRIERGNALIHQPGLRPVVVHERRIVDSAQVAAAVLRHLIKGEHRGCAVGLDGLRSVRDVRAIGTVPGRPRACADPHQVSINDIRVNTLALHLRQ